MYIKEFVKPSTRRLRSNKIESYLPYILILLGATFPYSTMGAPRMPTARLMLDKRPVAVV